MTSYQRAKRYWFWRGSAISLFFFTAWILASSYCSHLTQ